MRNSIHIVMPVLQNKRSACYCFAGELVLR